MPFWRRCRTASKPARRAKLEFRQIAGDGRRECHQAFWRGLRRQGEAGWRLIGMTQDITELTDARDTALKGQKTGGRSRPRQVAVFG